MLLRYITYTSKLEYLVVLDERNTLIDPIITAVNKYQSTMASNSEIDVTKFSGRMSNIEKMLQNLLKDFLTMRQDITVSQHAMRSEYKVEARRRILHVWFQYVAHHVSKDVLCQVFRMCGAVEEIRLHMEEYKLVAFIIYGSARSAERALEQL